MMVFMSLINYKCKMCKGNGYTMKNVAPHPLMKSKVFCVQCKGEGIVDKNFNLSISVRSNPNLKYKLFQFFRNGFNNEL